jgi:hypothetical protein
MSGGSHQSSARGAAEAGCRSFDRLALVAKSTFACSLAMVMTGAAEASDVVSVAATVGAAAFGAIEPAAGAVESGDSVRTAPEPAAEPDVDASFDGVRVAALDATSPVASGRALRESDDLSPEARRKAGPGPASPSPFGSGLPLELSMAGRSGAADPLDRTDVSSPIVMLEQRKLGPLVVEQPVRVYENDVTVKLRAPGRRRSFATVEVTF